MQIDVTSRRGPLDVNGPMTGLVIAGTRVWAVGGGMQRTSSPTILYSRAALGYPFLHLPAPRTTGLRGALLVADRLWVAGEHGMVATTRTDARDAQPRLDTSPPQRDGASGRQPRAPTPPRPHPHCPADAMCPGHAGHREQ